MTTIKFTTEDIQKISLFEAITGVEVKDYVITEDSAHFLVEEGKVGKAIGKGGKTIKRVQEQLKMMVYVHEYSKDLEQFVKNLVPAPLDKLEIQEKGEDKIV